MSLLFDVAGLDGIGNRSWQGVTVSNNRIVARPDYNDGNMWVINVTNGELYTDLSSQNFGPPSAWEGAAITQNEENIIVHCADDLNNDPGNIYILDGNGGFMYSIPENILPAQRWRNVIVTPDSARAIAYTNQNPAGDYGTAGDIYIFDISSGGSLTGDTLINVADDITNAPGIQPWRSIAVTSDGTHIVAVSRDDEYDVGNIWVFDISENNSLYDISSMHIDIGILRWDTVTIVMNNTRFFALSPKNPIVLGGDDTTPGNIWCFDLTNGNVIYDLSSEGIGRDIWDQVVVSPNNMRAITYSGGDSNSNLNMWFFDVSDCGHIVDISGSVGHQAWTGASFTSDGERVVAFHTDVVNDNAYPGNMWIFNSTTGSVLVDISSSVGPRRWAGAVPYENVNGAQRVVAYTDGTDNPDGDPLPGNMWIFDASNGHIVYDISASVGPQRWAGATVTPDGTRLVAYTTNEPSGNGPGNIWVFDLSNENNTTTSQTQTSTPAISNSYILGPRRIQSSRTEFNVGYFIRKPRAGQLDYDMNILRQMSAAQARLV